MGSEEPTNPIISVMERLNERKLAAGIIKDGLSGEDTFLLVISEADLEFKELFTCALIAAETAMQGIEKGNAIELVLQGHWIDGVVTGALAERQRVKEEREET